MFMLILRNILDYRNMVIVIIRMEGKKFLRKEWLILMMR